MSRLLTAAALAAVVLGCARPLEPSLTPPEPLAPPSPEPTSAPPPEEEDSTREEIEARFDDDVTARGWALALFDEFGDVADVEEEYEMDGGFRGIIQIVPERPVGVHRKHLNWVLSGQREIAAFLAGLGEHAERPMEFRHSALSWRFFRSVGRTTPSMIAYDWEVAYNVSGSLNRSEWAVRESIVHELFHLNDRVRGGWSRIEIGYAVDGIVDRCGTDVDCLKPYAPGTTKVRGGTYYAFQPDNGDIALEYAAELATRYFLEQRAALAGETHAAPPFKCGPWENARAWQALADEFFGGADLTADCPPAP